MSFREWSIDMSLDEWKEYRLSEVPIEIIDGDRGKNYPNGTDFLDDGYCLFLSARNVTKTGFSFEEKTFILKEKDEQLRKGKLQRKDIIMTTRGTVGNIAYYDERIPYEHLRINSGMVILRCDERLIDSNYAYYVFRSPQIQDEINSIRTGSAQPQLPITIMKGLKFVVPPMNSQKSIAHILSTLDEKIEVNNQINKTLENMAQTLFKQWLIDFEFPNENDEPYKSSGGEMVESELGLIPKGWKVGKLEDVANITMGQSPSGSSFNEDGVGTVFYQGRTDFGMRFPKVRLFTTEPKRMAKIGDILLSVRAPVGDLNISIEDCCIGRGLAALNSKNDCNSYLYYLMLELNNQFDVYNGEGTVFGSINKSSLHDIKVKLPNDEIVNEFQHVVSWIDDCIKNNSNQVNCLVRIRDTLLPKLMSGEIRVPIKESN